MKFDRIKLLPIVLLTLVAMTACGGDSDSSGMYQLVSSPTTQDSDNHSKKSVGYQILLNEHFSSLPENTLEGDRQAYEVFIDNQADFAKQWHQLTSQPVPTVDFSRQRVVIKSLGQISRNSAHVKVKSVVMTDKEVTVNFQTNYVGGDCMTAAVITYPRLVMVVDTTKPIIIANHRQEQKDCLL